MCGLGFCERTRPLLARAECLRVILPTRQCAALIKRFAFASGRPTTLGTTQTTCFKGLGTTGFEAPDCGPVPTRFVAVTVNV